MIRSLLIVLLCFGFFYSSAQKIYQADSVKDAQVKIFAVDEPNQADLWVCFVWDAKEITRTGLWMDMRFAHEADVIIFFVDDEKDSDLKIWLVDTPQESKWLSANKRRLLPAPKPIK